MSRELPKPIQDALDRQTTGEVHPSPDVLSAFAEHSLPIRENQRVTDHIARCADCREIVFLASSAIEEPVGEEQEWMPEDAVPRISPALQAKKLAPRVTASAAPPRQIPRRGWPWGWTWVPAVASVLIISGVLFVRHHEFRSAPWTDASKGAPPAATVSQPTSAIAHIPESEARPTLGSETALEERRTTTRSTRPQANPAHASGTIATAQGGPDALTRYAPLPEGAPLPPVAESRTTGAAAPLSAQNAFAESQEQVPSNLVAKAPSVLGALQTAIRGVGSGHPGWRITPDGHLERWNGGGWIRALAEQPITFRAVAVIGDNVWAGGNDGALFHSSDGGQSWSKQPVGSPSVETEAIVAIRFSDLVHGVVTTQGGARWGTSDGGVTWTKD